ncbi:diacylglycerol O-acyltransferase [Intrasporangium chromatireducens Q5-1]|uniref:Diacylglycerol O-acyltransferase n=1 Tax=Intrasporangium chromatireducens Q5-1 TaxID=584657 RepID=W9GTZ9_9MICO|nr:diacylglycerol O-acyltransferase [Intrasporangium chromatireducens Q5-1]
MDAMWLQMDRPNNLMVVASVLFLDGVPDFDEVRRLVRDRVVARYPVFRQRPLPPRGPLGGPSWTDDADFDLDRHVARVVLPPPGDDGALQSYIDERLALPFDRSHPLWELHLVEGYGSGAALVCRSHHALADGLALARVLLSLTEDARGRVADDDLDVDVSLPPEQTRAWPLSLATSVLTVPVRLGRLGLRGAGTLTSRHRLAEATRLAWRTAEVAAVLLFSSNPPSPLAGEPGPPKRVAWSERLPIRGLTDVRRLSGATLNDVLISATAAALHTYQLERRTDPVDLTTMVPVNVRPPDEPLPPELGNEFALVFLRLPSALGAPLARLAESKRRMDWIKASPEPVLTYGLINVIGRLTPELGRHVVDFFANKTIGVTTNVHGPDSVRYLAGTAVTGVLGWVPGSGRQILGICIFTYAGNVQVGFLSDASVVPDPERLVAAFEDELHRLVRMGRSGTRGGSRHADGHRPT